MSEELLPCPFCGEPANLRKKRFVSYDGPIPRCYWRVTHSCRLGNYAETKLCETKTEAIAAWNHRPIAHHVTVTVDERGTIGHDECSACGGKVDQDDAFCRHCGKELT